MNRRTFFASLIAIPSAAMAAVKTLARLDPVPFDMDKCFRDLKTLHNNRLLASYWMQTPRLHSLASIDHLDHLDIIMGLPEPERRAFYIQRRKKRSRANIAALKTMRPLPLP